MAEKGMKKIVLGIAGSIAAYKSCDLVRMFVKGGFDVRVIMTAHAMMLIAPLTFEVLSGNPVSTDKTSWEKRSLEHLSLRDGASLFLVSPATANIIGKFATGIADDLLSTTYLSLRCPVVVAPAMNTTMYQHRGVQANFEVLKKRGVIVVEPEEGNVAYGEEGMGRLADISKIYEVAIHAIA